MQARERQGKRCSSLSRRKRNEERELVGKEEQRKRSGGRETLPWVAGGNADPVRTASSALFVSRSFTLWE